MRLRAAAVFETRGHVIVKWKQSYAAASSTEMIHQRGWAGLHSPHTLLPPQSISQPPSQNVTHITVTNLQSLVDYSVSYISPLDTCSVQYEAN